MTWVRSLYSSLMFSGNILDNSWLVTELLNELSCKALHEMGIDQQREPRSKNYHTSNALVSVTSQQVIKQFSFGAHCSREKLSVTGLKQDKTCIYIKPL